MKGPVPTYDEVVAEFTERETRVQDAMEKERKSKEDEKARMMDQRVDATNRSCQNKNERSLNQ